MSLIEELRTRGVTVEDLERAAAARLFEKTAAAENVDLDLLSSGQVNNLFQNFITPATTKEASDMDYDTAVELFEKTAAAEEIDLDSLDDESLSDLFQHFINDILPEMVEDDGVDKEAAAQLDEAEILGRHMARAYMDELEKQAAGEQIFQGYEGRKNTPSQADYESMFGKGSRKPKAETMKANQEFMDEQRAKRGPLRAGTTGERSRGGRYTTTDASVADVAPKGAKYEVDRITGAVQGPDVKGRRGGSVSAQRTGQSARTAALKARAGERSFDRFKYRVGNQVRAVGQHLSRNRLPYGIGALGLAGAGAAYAAGRSQHSKRASAYDAPDYAAIELAAETLSNAYNVSYRDAAEDLCKVASANDTALQLLAESDIDTAAAFLLTELGVEL
jgi:hypothetical protein